jgi:glyoxylase-like metal-dependent hydrolase (beta-lactamase superfamily II)
VTLPASLFLRAVAIALLFTASAHATAAPALAAQQVSPSAWYVQGESALGSPANRNFVSNAGFIDTPAGAVVIDALGSPAVAREFIDEIRRRTGHGVAVVVLTHYHADHIYGLQEFKRAGAHVIAQRLGLEYLNSQTAQQRLEASRQDLAPWIDAQTRLVPADEWIDGPRELVVGGVRMLLQPVGPAHTPEDMVVYLPSERVLFSGDIVFRGRIPYVGQADSRHWIAALGTVLSFDPQVIVPGHGPASHSAREDIVLTRDYLEYLRNAMARAAQDMTPFDEAYANTDWSRFEHLPLFRAANRMNAYNTYLLMEQEAR